LSRVVGVQIACEKAQKIIDQMKKVVKSHHEGDESEKVKEVEKQIKEEEKQILAMKTWPCNIWDLGEWIQSPMYVMFWKWYWTDIIEAEKDLGNLLIELWLLNRDTVDVATSEEDQLTPQYQQLVAQEMKEGWKPQLWHSIPPTSPTNLHEKLQTLVGTSNVVWKFKNIARDPWTTQGMMKMTHMAKYYCVWQGFNINHLDNQTINLTASVHWYNPNLVFPINDADNIISFSICGHTYNHKMNCWVSFFLIQNSMTISPMGSGLCTQPSIRRQSQLQLRSQ
jgi:hypothetical protein